MEAETIAEREEILWNVDAQECGMCGRTIEPGAADDARWFVDALPNEDGTFHADIRCPACW